MSSQPLIPTAQLPNFEVQKSPQERAKDKEFEEKEKNATPEKTAQMKQEFQESIYRVKDNRENIGEKLGNQLDQFDIKELPLIKRMYDTGEISTEGMIKVLEYCENINDSLEGSFDLNKVSLSQSDFAVLDQRLGGLEEKNESDIQKNLDNFQQDFGVEFDDHSFDGNVYRLVASNYVQINSGEQKQDKQENFKTAVLISSKEILQRSKNLQRDTVTFQRALSNIHSQDAHTCFEGLKTLYVLDGVAEGSKGAKSSRLFEKNQKFVQERQSKLAEQYQELQVSLKNAQENNDKNKERVFQTELNEVVQEAKELDAGIFGEVGEVDVLNESYDNQKQETI